MRSVAAKGARANLLNPTDQSSCQIVNDSVRPADSLTGHGGGLVPAGLGPERDSCAATLSRGKTEGLPSVGGLAEIRSGAF